MIADSLLSTPGSGRHIQQTTQFLSRLLLCNLNLAQMKKITAYMLRMVDVLEQQKRISEYIYIFRFESIFSFKLLFRVNIEVFN